MLCIALVHIAVRTAAFYNIIFECLLPTDVFPVLVALHGSYDHFQLV